MRPTLPRGSRQKLQGFALLLIVATGSACSHGPPAVAPGPPIPAEAELAVDTADKECAALVTAINDWGHCANLDDDDRAWMHNMVDYAEHSFAAGKKGLDLKPDADGEKAIAIKCRQAAMSVGYAHQRCNAGPKPRADD